MNPTNKPIQPIQDISGSVPPTVQFDVSLPPSIVSNIPVKAQEAGAPPEPPPKKEDDELDQIMHDVNRQLKKEDSQSTGKRHGLFRRKPKMTASSVKLPARSPTQPPPAALPALPPDSPAVPKSKPPQPPSSSKPLKTSSAPILVICLALIVTAVLIGAAYYAYKK